MNLLNASGLKNIFLRVFLVSCLVVFLCGNVFAEPMDVNIITSEDVDSELILEYEQMLPDIEPQFNPADGNARKFAIMINAINTPENWDSVVYIYDLFVVNSFDTEDIYLLNYNGTAPDGSNPYDRIDYPANRASLLTVCEQLASVVDADDLVYVYISSAGYGYRGPESGFGAETGMVDPLDEKDYLESKFKVAALGSIILGEFKHGSLGGNKWMVQYNPDPNGDAELYRMKAFSRFDNIYIESEGGNVSDSDERIEMLYDFTLGDYNKNGVIEFGLGEVLNYNGGALPYNVDTGEFDEGDWGESGKFDAIDDDFNRLWAGVPAADFVLFDKHFDNCLDIDLHYTGGALVADGTDLDNFGLFDRMDVNEDGDFNDWVALDEFVDLYFDIIRDDELAAYLDLINPNYMVIAIHQNFSGGFIDDLSRSNRVIMTSTEEEKYSYEHMFSRNFVSALDGKNYPGSTTVHASLADSNGDGAVSMVEVFNFTAGNDTMPEIPLYDDNGDNMGFSNPIPNYTPVIDSYDGYNGNKIFLKVPDDTWVRYCNEGFEDGLGNFYVDGPAERSASGLAPNGFYSLRLFGDDGTFNLTTSLYLPAHEFYELFVTYSFYAWNLNNPDAGFFAEFYDGERWITIHHKKRDYDIVNNTYDSFSYIIDSRHYKFSPDSKIRFRGDNLAVGSELYFDDIKISVKKIEIEYNDARAGADYYVMKKNDILNIPAPGVLTNDRKNGYNLWLEAFPLSSAPPKHGEVILNRDGSFSYKPHINYVGIDTFEYFPTADKQNFDGLGTVTIEVQDYQYNPADGVEEKYALIISGTNEQRYWDDVTYIYDMLKEYGFADEDIWLLNADGNAPDGTNPDNMIDFPANKLGIHWGTVNLASHVDLDDTVYVWINGKGNGYLGQGNDEYGIFTSGIYSGILNENDYPENNFKFMGLETLYSNTRIPVGLNTWNYYYNAETGETYRIKYTNRIYNVWFQFENQFISDYDQDIEKIKDVLAGDTTGNGIIEWWETADADGDGNPPYDPQTGIFDEDDWGTPFDFFEDDIDTVSSKIPSKDNLPCRIFDYNFDGTTDFQFNFDVFVKVEATDLDNDGLFDNFDINQDGDYDDWISIDEELTLYGGDTLSDNDLGKYLEQIGAKAMVIIAGQNFSSGFVDDLSRPNRVILASSEEESLSYSNTFIRNIVSALSGKNYPGGTTVNPAEAHVNGDGAIDMVELFNFAAKNDYQKETPGYDDNGDGIYNAYPMPANGDGALGATIKLKKTSNPPVTLRGEGFEDGFGDFTSAGSAAVLYTGPYACEGNNAVNLQGNGELRSSFHLTEPLNLTSPPYNELVVEYSVNARGLDNAGEGFVVEYYDGVLWLEVDRKTMGNGLENDMCFRHIFNIYSKDFQFSENSDIRFRSISVDNDADIFIDHVQIRAVINPVDKPKASADTYYVLKNETLLVEPPGISANDVDPDGVGLFPRLHEGYGPKHGTLFLDNGNGAFMYTPDQDYVGMDSFEYFPTSDINNYTGIGIVRIYVSHGEPPSSELILYDDFEDGFGNYISGGHDAFLYTGGTYAKQGNNAVNVQDNSGIASSFSLKDGIDLATPGYNSLLIDFSYYVRELENIPYEGFWLQYFDGTVWSDIFYSWNIQNNAFGRSWAVINGSEYTFSRDSKIRFMCDASSDYDDIYFDTIYVYGKKEELTGPLAMADTYVTKENKTLTIPAPGILENDFDPLNNGLSAHVYPGYNVCHGTLSLNQDGSFTYVPDPGFNGRDSFIYAPTADLNPDSTGKVNIIVEKMLYNETFEDLCHCFSYITLINAPSTPTGDVGNYVGRLTIPYTCGSVYGKVYWHETCICLNGLTELNLKAKIGLAGPEKGDVRFRMSVRFNTCESVEGDFIELDSSAADNFVDYEDVINVPSDASYIRWVKFEFWQYNGNYIPSQTGYIDSISID